ncbi:DUF5330 domain-containing protein [Rhizobium sp. S163]|uniref:DUF5330 domain-containing protein n=1 Tax=Rhizobium sp. S163 TaxID=3055039 RepID=UPI0025AA1227|nr:DUF5330 domain-containing protein [Rhizobium sp. S163]MDM9647952.1 DUF5330 domain-containing protein [Rhizobium sp. S163]
MWFLFKSSIWLGLLFVALSFFSGERQTNTQTGSTLQIADAFVAVTGAYDYLSGMCGEKPEVCAKGANTLGVLGERARAGALVAFEVLDSKFGSGKSATVATTATPSVGLAPATTVQPATAAAPQQLRDDRTVALNQPMPYRPPVDDGEDSPAAAHVATDRVTTGTIPLPTPRPAI